MKITIEQAKQRIKDGLPVYILCVKPNDFARVMGFSADSKITFLDKGVAEQNKFDDSGASWYTEGMDGRYPHITLALRGFYDTPEKRGKTMKDLKKEIERLIGEYEKGFKNINDNMSTVKSSAGRSRLEGERSTISIILSDLRNLIKEGE